MVQHPTSNRVSQGEQGVTRNMLVEDDEVLETWMIVESEKGEGKEDKMMKIEYFCWVLGRG